MPQYISIGGKQIQLSNDELEASKQAQYIRENGIEAFNHLNQAIEESKELEKPEEVKKVVKKKEIKKPAKKKAKKGAK